LKIRFTVPLGVAVMALLVYGLTVSWEVTFHSLAFTQQVAGWDWQPMTSRPLAWLLTLPLRLLPEAWIPAGLNLFSAVSAAATLAILARSVQLLSWDCPPDPEKKWARWLPVWLACSLCGLEYNFWLNATEMTGEMVSLLLLAAAIVCLLEFRAAKNPRWLDLGAVVWGVGLAENWAMQLTLPIFLVALAWQPGNQLRGRKFLSRVAVMLLAAGVIFSLQPLLTGLAFHSGERVGELYWASLKYTMQNLATLFHGFGSRNRLLTVVVLMYFLLPVLACLLRIKNEATTLVHGVERMQINLFRCLRIGLLLVCVWLMFDPEVGPRKILLHKLNLRLPLLTFDYLVAVGAAFLLGSLLYAAQLPPPERVWTALEKMIDFLRRRTCALLTAFSLVVVAGLLARNMAAIQFDRQADLTKIGDLMMRSLPPDGGMLLGDDGEQLMTVKASLARHPDRSRWQLLEVKHVPNARYRRALKVNFPEVAGTNDTGNLNREQTMTLLNRLARSCRIYYLVPEPGRFLFEQFYPEAQGGVHELKLFGLDDFALPPLTEAQIGANEQFWQSAWETTLAAASRVAPAAKKSFPQFLALRPVVPEATQQLARWYAVALNNWGVELQRNGRLTQAKLRFEQAKILNPDNSAVAINLVGNSNLLAGKFLDLSGAASLAKSVQNVQQLARIVEIVGNFDEPAVCLLLGDGCFNAGWPRQALQQFDRARTLAPDTALPGLAMAKVFLRVGFPEKALGLLGELRRFETNSVNGPALNVELSLLEAQAWIGLTNAPEANRVLETIMQKNPDNPAVWETVFKAYLSFGSATNALGLLDRMLAKEPDNVSALNNKAAVLVQIQRASEAIPILDHAIAITNLPSMRLNRAIALLQAQDYKAAEAAYQELQTAAIDQFSVQFGLAQIAEARHDTNAAVKFYSSCLTNTPALSPKWMDAKARMNVLKPGGK
jgi:predicted Zn-dependent protease